MRKTESAFAPRKHVLSRSERRQYAEVVFPAFLTRGGRATRVVKKHHLAAGAAGSDRRPGTDLRADSISAATARTVLESYVTLQ